MKIKGVELKGLNKDFIVFQRNGDDVVITAQAVPDYKEFDKRVETPVPPKITKPGGLAELNFSDPKYNQAVSEYAELRTNFIIVYSLRATEGLEWDTVDYDKPNTWKNWRKDLLNADFTETDLLHIMKLVVKVNSLTDAMMDAARQDFLRRARLNEQLSLAAGEPGSI
jgi:hypothetical protein